VLLVVVCEVNCCFVVWLCSFFFLVLGWGGGGGGGGSPYIRAYTLFSWNVWDTCQL